MATPESLEFDWSEARTAAGIALAVVVVALAFPHVRDWIASRSSQQVTHP